MMSSKIKVGGRKYGGFSETHQISVPIIISDKVIYIYHPVGGINDIGTLLFDSLLYILGYDDMYTRNHLYWLRTKTGRHAFCIFILE